VLTALATLSHPKISDAHHDFRPIPQLSIYIRVESLSVSLFYSIIILYRQYKARCIHLKIIKLMILSRCAQIIQVSRRHLKTLEARMVTWSKLHTEDQQISDDNVRKFVIRVNWRPEFVHPWVYLICIHLVCKAHLIFSCSHRWYIARTQLHRVYSPGKEGGWNYCKRNPLNVIIIVISE